MHVGERHVGNAGAFSIVGGSQSGGKGVQLDVGKVSASSLLVLLGSGDLLLLLLRVGVLAFGEPVDLLAGGVQSMRGAVQGDQST